MKKYVARFFETVDYYYEESIEANSQEEADKLADELLDRIMDDHDSFDFAANSDGIEMTVQEEDDA